MPAENNPAAAIELEVVTPASGSYITQLWNNEIFHNRKNQDKSFIHPWSRYFTYCPFYHCLDFRYLLVRYRSIQGLAGYYKCTYCCLSLLPIAFCNFYLWQYAAHFRKK